jgi:hypothetical protein
MNIIISCDYPGCRNEWRDLGSDLQMAWARAQINGWKRTHEDPSFLGGWCHYHRLLLDDAQETKR